MIPKKSDIQWYRRQLADWYAAHHRHLPWHGESNGYRVLVSEVMLVQTTVATVLPRYQSFLDQFPTVRRLADASEGEVLKAWEGLGYYRRARQLHAAAKVIVERHDGVVPRSVDELRELPGVGRYMAGAIASFAYDVRAPILEANTRRVLARVTGFAEVVTTGNEERLWAVAEALVPETGPGDFNQAFMELGQRVCSAAGPRCGDCPWAAKCAARASGDPEAFPAKAVKAAPTPGREVAVRAIRDGRVLMKRRAKGTLWEDMWEFPAWHVDGANPAARDSASEIPWRLGEALVTIRYAVTRYRMTMTIHEARVDAKSAAVWGGRSDCRWVALDEVSELTLPSPVRKALERVSRVRPPSR